MNGHTVGLTGETTIADWLQLIRAEYAEVPGLHLTKAEVQDLWGLDAWVCDALLNALVDAGFLRCIRDDTYVRADAGESRFELENHVSDVTTPQPRIQHADRLVSAKEDERRLLAREQHDDISQRLALLAIGIARLVQQTPDRNTLRARLRDLWQTTTEIAEGVHHLSHQLHPVTLEAFGKVACHADQPRRPTATGIGFCSRRPDTFPTFHRVGCGCSRSVPPLIG